MKITRKILKRYCVCKEAYAWFLKKYENKEEVEFNQLLTDAGKEDLNWSAWFLKRHLIDSMKKK